MKLQEHVKYTALGSAAMLPFFTLPQIISFAIGSIFVDIDHYLFYVFRVKKLDLKSMFEYCNSNPPIKDKIPYAGVFIFHTLEFLVVLGFASQYYPLIGFILIGILFHMVLDTLHFASYNHVFFRAFSFIEHLIRVRKHKPLGYPYF